jgi:hypothetical protein
MCRAVVVNTSVRSARGARARVRGSIVPPVMHGFLHVRSCQLLVTDLVVRPTE